MSQGKLRAGSAGPTGETVRQRTTLKCITASSVRWQAEQQKRVLQRHSQPLVWLCRLPGMVDVKSRRCVVDGCNRYPAFNTPGEMQSKYCGAHKQPGMIDVHNKRCMH